MMLAAIKRNHNLTQFPFCATFRHHSVPPTDLKPRDANLSELKKNDWFFFSLRYRMEINGATTNQNNTFNCAFFAVQGRWLDFNTPDNNW